MQWATPPDLCGIARAHASSTSGEIVMSSQIGSLGAAGSLANSSIINPLPQRQQGIKALSAAQGAGETSGVRPAEQALRASQALQSGAAAASDPTSPKPRIGSLINTTA
jgi:hypothetical protein